MCIKGEVNSESMEYNDAMQYLMDSIKEDEKIKAEGKGFTSATDPEYEADYELLCQLSADLEVLKQKHEDYKKLEKKAKEDFELMVKKLAALQIREEELDSIGWKKICSVLTGKYEKQRAELDNDKLFAQTEMNAVKMDIETSGERLREVIRAQREIRNALNAQRKYMKMKYGEDNRYELEVEHKNMLVRAVIKEIDEAVIAVNKILHQNIAAELNANSADQWSTAANVTYGLANIIPIAALGTLASSAVVNKRQSEVEGNIIVVNSMIPIVVKELQDVIDAYRKFNSEYSDGDPYEDLNDENDLDHAIDFIRANLNAIKGRRIYCYDDIYMLNDRLSVIISNLSKEKRLMLKEIIK